MQTIVAHMFVKRRLKAMIFITGRQKKIFPQNHVLPFIYHSFLSSLRTDCAVPRHFDVL